jgi:DNA polymerase-1
MRGKHPIINHIFSYRELAKLKSTYIDALPSLINRADGRIHTSFNQTITTTGRLSSSDPNMQNIPVRTDLGREIRRAFIAEKGYLLLSLDYSQIDLRAAAHLSGDKSIIQIFKEDKDIHTMTAARLFNKKSSEVSPEERSRAKEANFGVLYGLGPRGLAERLGLSQLEAEDFIDRYKNVYPQVFKYLEGVIESTRRLGYVETLFGRRRYLPEINSGSSVLAAQAERAALNMPVQGTSSDIIKKAMIEIRSKLKGQSSKLEIRMLLQVHDELVFEVREDRVKKWAKVIKEEMENAVRLKVPLKVEAKVGRSWGEMAVI